MKIGDWGRKKEGKKHDRPVTRCKKIEECLGNIFKNEVSSVSFGIP